MNCRLCDKEIKQSQGRIRGRCNSCNTKIRRLRAKRAAIEYLGGECRRCGFSGHDAALTFHHRDPTEKSFNVGMVANRAWAVIKNELDKCDLLCANCHNIEHSDRNNPRFLKELEEQEGNLFI